MNSNCLENMKCPKCGEEDEIFVQMKIWASLKDEGTDSTDSVDTEYDNDSPAECPNCEYTGTLGDWDVPVKKEEKLGYLTDQLHARLVALRTALADVAEFKPGIPYRARLASQALALHLIFPDIKEAHNPGFDPSLVDATALIELDPEEVATLLGIEHLNWL